MEEHAARAIAEIDAAGLGAERWRTARKLLDISDDNGACYISYDELAALTGCASVQAALRHLTVLAAADVIHYSTNEIVYIRFRSWTRSNGAPTRSNGAPTRSNGAPTRSNGAPTRSNGAPTRSNGAPTRSNGAPTRSNGAPTRSNGAPPERKPDDPSEADALIDLIDHHHLNKMIDRSIINQWLETFAFDEIADAVRRAANYNPKNLAAYVSKLLSNLPRGKDEPIPVAAVEAEAEAEDIPARPEPEVAEPEPELPDQTLWDKAKSEMRLQLASSTYFTWLADTWLVEVDDEHLVVATASTYAVDWLQHRLRSVVQRTLKNIVGHAVEVTFVVRPHRRESG